jgi:hypothetical protein
MLREIHYPDGECIRTQRRKMWNPLEIEKQGLGHKGGIERRTKED